MPGTFCCGDRSEDGPAVGGKAYMWCVTGDWCAYLCVPFVFGSLIAIDWTTTFYCIIPMYKLTTWKGMAHLAFFQTTVFMVVLCHLFASWSDPGLVSKDNTGIYVQLYETELKRALEEEKNGGDFNAVRKVKKAFCRKCATPKPEGSHHCSICNRCVRKMDHHCPWVNNCVGERNLKAFVLFLFYVMIGTGYALVMYVLRTYQVVTAGRLEDRYTKANKNYHLFVVVSCVISFILAGFFFAFILCMFYDMYEAFVTGVPGIDAMQYKDDIPRKQSCWKGMKEMAMANERFNWRWFVPLPPKLPKRIPPPLPKLKQEISDTRNEVLNENDHPTLAHRFPEPEESTTTSTTELSQSQETLVGDTSTKKTD